MVLANADPVTENLHFLILEIKQQIKRTSLYLVSNDIQSAVTLLDHNDYLVNMTTIVKNYCIKAIVKNENQYSILVLRNIYDIANIFSNIGFSLVDILHHTSKEALQALHSDAFTEQIFSSVLKAINKIEEVFNNKNPRLGLQLSTISEQVQDDVTEYSAHIAQLEMHFINTGTTLSLSRVISMFTNIALNIVHLSESVLSIEQNKVVTIRQFQALKSVLKQMGGQELAQEASFDRIGETKSGCSIVGVSTDKTSSDYIAIFKEGKKDKIKEEKKQFDLWNKLFPGMAPKVFSYKKKGRSAGILVEYLKGKTFEQLLLAKNRIALNLALDTLCETMNNLWLETKNTQKTESAKYIAQIKKRLPAILQIHPEYDEPRMKFGKIKAPGLRKLLTLCEEIEVKIDTPFSVFTHGDFNIDNIIFDTDNGHPRFIDLHRSKNTDYLQDVSVFMVSNYRIKVLDPEIRSLINHTMQRFYTCAEAFAFKNNDKTFQLRLCLGLARSYITSTRFTLDEKHADAMFMRGKYLLEKVIRTPEEQLHNFILPKGIFID